MSQIPPCLEQIFDDLNNSDEFKILLIIFAACIVVAMGLFPLLGSCCCGIQDQGAPDNNNPPLPQNQMRTTQ